MKELSKKRPKWARREISETLTHFSLRGCKQNMLMIWTQTGLQENCSKLNKINLLTIRNNEFQSKDNHVIIWNTKNDHCMINSFKVDIADQEYNG